MVDSVSCHSVTEWIWQILFLVLFFPCVVNLLYVAVHELGHSLGLGHSNIRGSVMFPTYPGFSQVALHSDDIAAIQMLYGKTFY